MMAEGRRYPTPTLEFENNLWEAGFTCLAGVDEAGRGAWAGPVAAGAVILPPDPQVLKRLSRVRDSKLMTPRERELWAPHIQEQAASWGVGLASASEIDQLGILPATRLAAQRAMANLNPQALITDYLLFTELELPQVALVKGDQRSLSVAAASVLAKTARDAWMRRLEGQFPGYGFARHKGYGTCQHRLALQQMGACQEHRHSFKLQIN